MTSNHWNYSYVGTFSQFPCYDVIIFQSQKVCYRSAHYSVAKALEESSLEIVEKIFFLSGNTKQTNIIKIMNNPDYLQRNLLTLISINILKKVFFINWKKLMLVQPLQTLHGKKLRIITKPCLLGCDFFCKHKFRDKIIGNCDRF